MTISPEAVRLPERRHPVSSAPPVPSAPPTPVDVSLTANLPSIKVDGIVVHLVDAGHAKALIADSAGRRPNRPLAVASINLDHLHHFGSSRGPTSRATKNQQVARVEWLNLIDGAPIAKHAERVKGTFYPKLSGSDLVLSILEEASLRGQSVGFLGGSPEVTDSLVSRIAKEWPSIRFAGHWTPARTELSSTVDAQRVAREIAAQDVDILVVCLGKPRQEDWIEEFGAMTGAGVLLAFGAVVDFLAGRVSRAPQWVSRAGMEWAWRLALEPRRLARRYLIQGPPAYLALRRSTNG
ncbi:WecB/TagA/CpsF family glycosyltransferase [Microbacterium deminutum]|uniref:Glycosyltransferase n=1 Tax=Microbacterium deminutum TaxID=344164 RepID=A0ABP5BWY5_9MICO